jgi:hypothetical protein
MGFLSPTVMFYHQIPNCQHVTSFHECSVVKNIPRLQLNIPLRIADVNHKREKGIGGS